MYEYRCVIVEVIDGDTVDVDIDLGFGVWMRSERIRIQGVDTPESKTSDKEEKVFGLLAKKYGETLLPVGKDCIMMSMEFRGKFGRILGDIKVDGVTLSESLLSNHLAVPYNGENKQSVADAHLANRKILIEQGKVTL
jgi:micrococcal nuclease